MQILQTVLAKINRLCRDLSVTYIATGSAKAAKGAGLSAALFMGIGGLREVK
ncbi:hypothetical protein BSPWISOXPB_5101 [uncultured Gammaproteobacteria bacterium]|nr:hypothetical protein BSPWISOXPB_5101 [uncultured Gammaproteobacteria bacterium]